MSSICNVNIKYDLTAANGIPKSCNAEQTDDILLKGLQSSDPDQRYAAIKRLGNTGLKPIHKKTLLKMLKTEKDPYVLVEVISTLAENGVKEAVPDILKKLSDPKAWSAAAKALATLTDSSNIGQVVSSLKAAFKTNPSRILAELLLYLGEPLPYLENFAKGDLEIFGAEDTYIHYTEPYLMMLLPRPMIGFFVAAAPHDSLLPNESIAYGGSGQNEMMPVFGGSKEAFAHEIRPTAASQMKPAAKENLILLLKVLKIRPEPKALPLLFAMLKDPRHPVPKPQIAGAVLACSTEKELPVLLAELGKGDPLSAVLILSLLEDKVLKGEVTPEQSAAISKKVMNMLKNEKVRSLAIKFLANIGEAKVVPELMKSLQGRYCALEVQALVKLGADKETLIPIFKNILADPERSGDSRLYAAWALAAYGDRSGLKILLEGLYQTALGAPTPENLERTQDLILALVNILKPKDTKHLKKLLNSYHPQAVILGLKLLSKVGSQEDVALVLSRLKDNNLDTVSLKTHFKLNGLKEPDQNDIENFQLEVRINALQTLAIIRNKDDQETLNIIKKEVAFWKDRLAYKKAYASALAKVASKNSPPLFKLSPEAFAHLGSPETAAESAFYAMIEDVIPRLEDYVEACEYAVAQKEGKSDGTPGLSLPKPLKLKTSPLLKF